MPEDKNGKVVPIHATIRKDQDDMLKQHADTWGYISVSQTLRVILDEWKAARERDLQAAHMTN